MSLADLLATFEERPVSITVYSATTEPAVDDWLGTRHVTFERRQLPDGADSFVVVRHREEFVASVPLEAVHDLLEPTIARPWDHEFVSATYRILFDVLDETVFSSLDRRQLLAVAREIEHRAWTAGAGQLRVGFQSLSAMADQVPVYRRLGAETDLEIHVYGSADWDPPPIANVTVHEESTDEIGDYWFLALDGRDETTPANRTAALLAVERHSDVYQGFWTYDADAVEAILTHLRETYE